MSIAKTTRRVVDYRNLRFDLEGALQNATRLGDSPLIGTLTEASKACEEGLMAAELLLKEQQTKEKSA